MTGKQDTSMMESSLPQRMSVGTVIRCSCCRSIEGFSTMLSINLERVWRRSCKRLVATYQQTNGSTGAVGTLKTLLIFHPALSSMKKRKAHTRKKRWGTFGGLWNTKESILSASETSFGIRILAPPSKRTSIAALFFAPSPMQQAGHMSTREATLLTYSQTHHEKRKRTTLTTRTYCKSSQSRA